MREVHGKPVSPGYARGKAFVYDPLKAVELPRRSIQPGQVSTEHTRLHEALERSAKELRAIEKRVVSELGRAEAEIFSAHLAMLKDKSFIRRVKDRIEGELINVEHALDQEVADLTRLLSEVESEYLRERAKDVRDIGRRVLKHLGHGPQDALRSLSCETVLVTEELLPSDTLNIDRGHLVAFVTERGGGTSHAAILARSLGIPAVTGVPNAITEIPDGAEVLVDGETGKVTVAPSSVEIVDFAGEKDRYDTVTAQADEAERKTSVTGDGTPVQLMANVGRPEEVALVLKHNLAGIGLFRTEYLFLEAHVPPEVELQASVYEQVVKKLSTRPVTIRTLDLGGDKKPPFLETHFEYNPSLGTRGLRFSLMHKDLLCAQLIAVLKSASRGNVRLLFPMVLGSDDLCKAINETKAAADRVGVERVPSIGAMIETPAALFELDEILRFVDFVSIGTNDLVQFLLAADRSATDLAAEEMLLHPSVLRAISRVVEAARKLDRPVCVCGEAAGNPRMACLLVGLGVRELSMSPTRAARVRSAIRRNHISDLRNLAQETLQAKSSKSIRDLINRIEIAGPAT